jgi:hypothetical protein
MPDRNGERKLHPKVKLAFALTGAAGLSALLASCDDASVTAPTQPELDNTENQPKISEAIVVGDRFGAFVENDGSWGTFEVGKQNLGVVQEIRNVDMEDVDEQLIESIDDTTRLMHIRDHKVGFLEVRGDESSALMPFVWTTDENGQVNSRWSVWSMEDGKISAPNKNNSDELVLVELSKLESDDFEFVGPVRDRQVEEFIVIWDKAHTTIKLPYKDSMETPISIENLMENEDIEEFVKG